MTLADIKMREGNDHGKVSTESIQMRSGVLGVRNDYLVSGQFVESGTTRTLAIASNYDSVAASRSPRVDRSDPRSKRHRSITTTVVLSAAAATVSGVFVSFAAVPGRDLAQFTTGITLFFVSGVVFLVALGLLKSLSD